MYRDKTNGREEHAYILMQTASMKNRTLVLLNGKNLLFILFFVSVCKVLTKIGNYIHLDT